MTDCDHHHDQKHGTRRLIIALAVISVFMVVEAIGGILSGSLALLADSVHMLTDALALSLAISAHWLSRRPADERRHFGYRRTQVLAAFVNGLFLSALLAWIFVEAVIRLRQPVQVDTQLMLSIAMIGLLANIVAYVVLHGAAKNDINIRGAMLHVISDLLGSVAAIIAALVIMSTGWTGIDPLLSMLVALLIARSAYKLLRETGHILLEGAPKNIDVAALIEGVREAAPAVTDVHDVQIWQLTPQHPRLTMHARVVDPAAAAVTLDRIKTYLEKTHGIRESTVQIEIGSDCPDSLSAAAPLRHAEEPDRVRPHAAEINRPGGPIFVGK